MAWVTVSMNRPSGSLACAPHVNSPQMLLLGLATLVLRGPGAVMRAKWKRPCVKVSRLTPFGSTNNRSFLQVGRFALSAPAPMQIDDAQQAKNGSRN